MSVDAHFTLGFIKKVNRTMNEIVSPTLRPSLERRARCYRRNATSLRRPNARRSDPSAHQSSNDLACCSLGYDPKKRHLHRAHFCICIDFGGNDRI